jgi:membrane protein DedA with SNARE-associated domain
VDKVSAGLRAYSMRIFSPGIFALMFSGPHWMEKLGSSAGAWIMSFGGLGVFFLAIGDSSFLSVPEGNDILIILLSAGGSWGHMAYFVGLTIMGSVVGCLLLYLVGRKGGNPILKKRFSEQRIERAESLFKKYGILTVLIPSIIPPPMPFKIFVLSAGVFRLNLMAFLTAVIIGRTIRYSTWGILAVLYGESVKEYLQGNLDTFGWVFLAGFVLIVGAIFIYYIYRKKTGKMS